MVPRPLFSAVAACLALEGYSILTAPAGLVRAVVARLMAERGHAAHPQPAE